MSHAFNPFRKGTKNHSVAEMLLSGMDREAIFRAIYPLVLAQTEPFVFTENRNGTRYAKPVNDQIPIAFYQIGLTRESLLAKDPKTAEFMAVEDRVIARNYGSKAWRISLYNQVRRDMEATVIPVPEPAPAVIPDTPVKMDGIRHKLETLQRRLYEIRQFVESKKVGGRDFDTISTRAFVAGKAAIVQGIEVEDFLVSIGLNWDSDTRRAAGIKETVDFSRYAIDGYPERFGFIVRLAKAGIPVYLYGPAGSGKSVMATKLAEYLNLNYGEIALSGGVSRTDLFGNWNAKGFIGRPLPDLYRNGGVFCFEEIDGADPNILLSVNNAIANNSLFNTSNGEEIPRSSDFIAIATANTLGNGANSNYSAREGLDGSTLDRFKYGRVFCGYSPTVENSILFEDIEELEAAENVTVA